MSNNDIEYLQDLLNTVNLKEKIIINYCRMCFDTEENIQDIFYYYNIKKNDKYVRIPNSEFICEDCAYSFIFNCYLCNQNFLISSVIEGYKDKFLTKKIILCNECHTKYACSICNYLRKSLRYCYCLHIKN